VLRHRNGARRAVRAFPDIAARRRRARSGLAGLHEQDDLVIRDDNHCNLPPTYMRAQDHAWLAAPAALEHGGSADLPEPGTPARQLAGLARY